MTITQKSCTFSAKSSDAGAATDYVRDAIMAYAQENNYSIATISHAMIQQEDIIEVIAIAVFQQVA